MIRIDALRQRSVRLKPKTPSNAITCYVEVSERPRTEIRDSISRLSIPIVIVPLESCGRIRIIYIEPTRVAISASKCCSEMFMFVTITAESMLAMYNEWHEMVDTASPKRRSMDLKFGCHYTISVFDLSSLARMLSFHTRRLWMFVPAIGQWV